jgi:thiol-disulfide isomerase/thioredoxin
MTFGVAGVGCSKEKTSAPAPQGPTSQSPANLKDMLAAHKGQTLVLLVGMEGCPGTAKGTEDMEALASKKVPYLALVRMDVPAPAQECGTAGPWAHSFTRIVDKDRRLAEQLDFFFYPTTYVFDGDGDLRFTGAYEPAKIEQMVSEIQAQKPGEPKKIFTPPMPPVGQRAPDLAGATMAGEPATLDSLRGKRGTLVVFAKTSCPFSVGAMPGIKALAQKYQKDGLAVVVANIGEDKDKLVTYKDLSPAVAVLWDKDQNATAVYGTDMVPFFFLLDKDGNVVKRRPYTGAAASEDINLLLGIAATAPAAKPSGAG